MIVLEFFLVSFVGGCILAAGFILWDNWRERVRTRTFEKADAGEKTNGGYLYWDGNKYIIKE